ncbi:hypothetical protein VPH35_098116 [Triticum aestivum]
MARWNEIKALEGEKWKAKSSGEERKLKAEERRLALEEKMIRDAKKAEECATMFMNPNTMDETARKYWELTRGEILEASLQNVGGGRGGRVDGGGRGGGCFGTLHGKQKFSTHTQDLSIEMHSYERGRASTYPCRSLSGSIYHAVDVVLLFAIRS